MSAIKDFIAAMTDPKGLRQMKGYDEWWRPVAKVPYGFENISLRDSGKKKFRYQQWVQGKWGRWRPVYNFKSLQSAMEVEL